MSILRVAGCTRRSLLAFALPAVIASLASAQPVDRGADALLAIDQHRASVVEHIVSAWGPALAKSSAQVSIDDLRTRLAGLRADALLAASLAGTLDGLREVIGADDISIAAKKPGLTQTKALGDSAVDVVYTPVTPCRLVETRGTFPAVYQGNGTASHTPVPFTSNQIRTYTLQGGNGVCLTQLPAGLNASAVQLQVFGIPTTSASGDIEILPQGASFGSTATMVYVATIPFNTVSTAAKANLANHQISVQVRGGGAHLAIDVVGYFAAPSGSGGKFFMQGGNSFGTTATLGTIDNQAVTLLVGNQPSLRLIPANDGVNAGVNVINGSPVNTVAASAIAATIGGGGASSSGVNLANQVTGPFGTVSGGIINSAAHDSSVGGGEHNSASGDIAIIAGGAFNTASGFEATVAGGAGNTASGTSAIVVGGVGNTASGATSFAAGNNALADEPQCAVLGFFASGGLANCKGIGNIIRLMANHGFSVDWGPATGNGGGTWWVEINDITPCRPINTYTNAYLSCSGVWTNNSDRNKKENFATVDARAVLAKLVGLPITQWNYKVEPGVLRMGPVAQDFHAVFGLGADEVTITPIDEAGVSFAAIQGLYQVMQEKEVAIQAQQRVIEMQQRELGDLRHEIGELRAAVAAVLHNGSLAAAGNLN